jgi:hypothetical protein
LRQQKVDDNFVANTVDTEIALFGVRTWEIWHWQGRAANQENLDEADFMETKFASLPRRISCKERWSTPQDTQRTYIQPPRLPKMVTLDIHSPESRHKMRDEIR